MLKRFAPALVLVLLMAASVAHAQYGGGPGGGGMGGGGHGRGGGGRGGGHGGGGSGADPGAAATPRKPLTPVNEVQIIGVVKAVDLGTERITIAYEPVEALGWPAGTQPFPVEKSAMLKAATVGQKVRFSLDSGYISALTLVDSPQAAH